MSDKTVSWIVAAAFAGALTLLMVTGCASKPQAASGPKALQKTKSHRKPAGKKPSTHKVCGWGDTGRWECHEAPINDEAPDEEQWDEL